MKKLTTKTIALLALAIALNLVLGNLALFLKLPIYLDTIGTILSSILFGPFAGMLVGGLTGLISGVTTDLYALYFAPVQLLVGLMTGILFHQTSEKAFYKAWPFFLKVFLVTLPGTIAASLITLVLFGGVTSSGSSVIVQLLTGLGVDKSISVFLIQFLTDYADKFLALTFVTTALRFMPHYRRFVI